MPAPLLAPRVRAHPREQSIAEKFEAMVVLDEALIALPEQLFYNTGIATYIWVLTNRKARERKGKVQLIDATSFWVPMRKSLGDKWREVPLDKPQDVLRIFRDGRIFPTTHFGFRKITVERPLRLNFHASPDRMARVEEEKGFLGLAQSRKKGAAGAKEQAAGRELQDAIRRLVRSLAGSLVKDGDDFERQLDAAVKEGGVKLPARHGRRPCRRCPSATRQQRSAVTRTAIRSPTRNCAIPKGYRSGSE
jgi:type I restriction enzyme M protein